MSLKLYSIPTILNEQFGGNGAAMAQATGLSELTISKYREDWNCLSHIVIDGELYTRHKCTRPFEVKEDAVPQFLGRINSIMNKTR